MPAANTGLCERSWQRVVMATVWRRYRTVGRNAVLPALTGCRKPEDHGSGRGGWRQCRCRPTTNSVGPAGARLCLLRCGDICRNLAPPPPGLTFVNANVTSMRAHYETVFDFLSHFVGLQETRLTQVGQHCMQQLARELGWDYFLGFPHSSPTRGIWGAPQGGVGVFCKRDWICRKVDATSDLLQQKFWQSGRWLHVIACLWEGREYINIQVVSGITENPALNRDFSEAIICYSLGVGNTGLIVLTNALQL